MRSSTSTCQSQCGPLTEKFRDPWPIQLLVVSVAFLLITTRWQLDRLLFSVQTQCDVIVNKILTLSAIQLLPQPAKLKFLLS
jgi:hypothetical protein